MANKFGIPKEEEERIRKRDKLCIYCHKKMLYPVNRKRQGDSATIEHLNFDRPFYWKEGLKIKDVAICCGRCNSSRGSLRLTEWFKKQYCIDNNINSKTVADSVKEYLKRNPTK